MQVGATGKANRVTVGKVEYFKYIFIVFDLDDEFKVDKQYCYFDILVDDHSGLQNF